MSALTGAAAGRKPQVSEERKYHKTCATINLRKLLKAFNYMDLYSASEAEELEKLFKKLATAIPEQWRDIDWPIAAKTALDRLFGDPQQMQRESLKLRQYAIPYWNPTAHTINIHSLGLKDEDGTPLDLVKPQGIVGIPATYTVGGRYSTIQGVAPQLKPVPLQQGKDSIFGTNITPSSYVEWITYCSMGVSACCKAPHVWSDAKKSLLCNKCKGQHAPKSG